VHLIQTITARKSTVIIAESFLYSFAALSLAYAVVTAFGRGEDLLILRFIGRTWLEESQRQNFFGYPPFAAVLFTPLALLSFDHLRVLWLGMNLAAAGLCLKLLARLWGANWTTRTVWRLAAVFVSWAGFRATLRNGQLSLLITALVLGALLARMKKERLIIFAMFWSLLYNVWKADPRPQQSGNATA
jgi:alpha-1,2-mannosyltransferase